MECKRQAGLAAHRSHLLVSVSLFPAVAQACIPVAGFGAVLLTMVEDQLALSVSASQAPKVAKNEPLVVAAAFAHPAVG